jgi:hypothetical protein
MTQLRIDELGIDMTESLDKIKYIESIAKLELFSIIYVCECLTDNSLEVRYSAYQKLRSANLDLKILSDRQIELINFGILLNPDDIVWSVYQSGLNYNDSDYGICDFSNDSGENIYGKEIDVSYYELWNKEVAHKFISTHIDLPSAQAAADRTIKAIIARDEYPYSGYYDLDLQVEEISQQDIYNLAKQYHIPDLPYPQDSRIIKRWKDRESDELYWMYEQQLHQYAIDILKRLTVDEHYELIDKIYGNLFGRLAYVCKETVRETTYFKP